jgi:hypothetical protein
LGGGTRNQYRALRIADGAVGAPINENLSPFSAEMRMCEGATVQVPPGVLVVCLSCFCGRESITIYANPADAPRFIGEAARPALTA